MTAFSPTAQIQTLVRHEVRFVIVGGVASNVLGSPSVTHDLDVCYDRRPDNLARLAAALVEMEATLRGVDDDVPFLLDARTLAAGDCFTFSTKFGPFDILGTPSGSAGYDDLRSRAAPADFGGFSVWVVSLDDLMAMKRAAGRAKDRIELEVLGALRDELESRPERE
jgi:hypothetical protein